MVPLKVMIQQYVTVFLRRCRPVALTTHAVQGATLPACSQTFLLLPISFTLVKQLSSPFLLSQDLTFSSVSVTDDAKPHRDGAKPSVVCPSVTGVFH